MNGKAKGEMGQLCVLGHLARLHIPVAIVLSDNLPYEYIIDCSGKLLRVQVKTSTCHHSGAITFSISSNNWYAKTKKTYTTNDCDIMICYDLVYDKVYILGPEDFVDKSTVKIRYIEAKNKQTCNMAEDYELTKANMEKKFNVILQTSEIFPEYAGWRAGTEESESIGSFFHTCVACGKEFESSSRFVKYCGDPCYYERKKVINRPNAKELEDMLKSLSWVAIGEKYGVSDNAVKKWCDKLGVVRPEGCIITPRIQPSKFTLRPDGSKICTKCGETKQSANFQYRSNTSDNLDSQCKACRSQQKREQRKNRNQQ